MVNVCSATLRRRYHGNDMLFRIGRKFAADHGFITQPLLFGAIAPAVQALAWQMKLSQMKSDFVSNVSGELRTPLAPFASSANACVWGA